MIQLVIISREAVKILKCCCAFIVLERPAVSCSRGKFKAPFIIRTTICGADERFGCPPTAEQTEDQLIRQPLWLYSTQTHEVAVCLVLILWSPRSAQSNHPGILTTGSALCPNRPPDPQTQRFFMIFFIAFNMSHLKSHSLKFKQIFVKQWMDVVEQHLEQICQLHVLLGQQVTSQTVTLHSNLKTTLPKNNRLDLCHIMQYIYIIYYRELHMALQWSRVLYRFPSWSFCLTLLSETNSLRHICRSAARTFLLGHLCFFIVEVPWQRDTVVFRLWENHFIIVSSCQFGSLAHFFLSPLL